MNWHELFLEYSIQVSIVLISCALVLVFIRLCLGPDLPDRVISLDLFTFLLAGFIGTYCIKTSDSSYLDVAITIALMGFLATLGFARYVHRVARKNLEKHDE